MMMMMLSHPSTTEPSQASVEPL